MKIAVLFGGASEERDVSVASAAQILPALRRLGHQTVAIDTAGGRLPPIQERLLLEEGVAPSPPPAAEIAMIRGRGLALSSAAGDIRDADLVFIALHGGAGEDGRIQALLDLAEVPYTGSNHSACAAAMDKDVSKRLFRAAGVPTPDWTMAPASADQVHASLGWPAVVKPNKQGSTIGLAVVRQADMLAAALRRAASFDREVMIERYIPGREFTVGILDGQALPVGEIVVPGEVFDYRAKYQPGLAHEQFPAPLPRSEALLLQELALRAHAALKLGSYSRIDFRRDRDGQLWCLEANALPGLTATSLLPQAAQAAGIGFAQLLQRICDGAIGRRRRVLRPVAVCA